MKIFLKEFKEGKKIAFLKTKLNLNVGDVFKIDNNIRNSNWSQSKKVLENAFELYREKHHPDKPSRLISVFTSPYKNNRFNRFGTTYLVELFGKTHYADSRIIDNAMQRISADDHNTYSAYENVRDLANWYWRGFLNEKKDIEILSDEVKIINIIRDVINVHDEIQLLKPMEAKIFLKSDFSFFKKNNIIHIEKSKYHSHHVILPTGFKLKIEYVPEKVNGKIFHVAGYAIGDNDKNEINIENDNLLEKIKLI